MPPNWGRGVVVVIILNCRRFLDVQVQGGGRSIVRSASVFVISCFQLKYDGCCVGGERGLVGLL